MSTVPLLFQLPDAWLASFLSEWLDMPSIGMLDTAVSSKQHRPQFLSSLQNMRSTSVDGFYFARDRFHVKKLGELTGLWWRWLSIRQIFVERINLERNAVRSNLIMPSVRVVDAGLLLEDDDIYYLVRNCPSLRSLDVGYSHVSPVGLGMLANVNQTLEEISVSGLPMRGQPDRHADAATALIGMLRRCPRLQKVSVIGGSLYASDLDALLPYSHLFHELQFKAEVQTATYGPAISHFLGRCGNLRTLRYWGPDVQGSPFLAAVRQSCPLLEVLHLLEITFNQSTDILTLIRHHCTHIRTLVLRRCDLFPSIFQSIAGMTALRDLTLTSCSSVTDSGIAVLATMKLQSLSIDVDNRLTGSCMQSLTGSHISQTLEKFSLYAFDRTNPPIDDVQMSTALASCHKLKTLDVYFARPGACVFGRRSLVGLAAGCPLLADASLELTDGGIHYLGSHCANLKKCKVFDRHSRSTISIKELQALYPAVSWKF